MKKTIALLFAALLAAGATQSQVREAQLKGTTEWAYSILETQSCDGAPCQFLGAELFHGTRIAAAPPEATQRRSAQCSNDPTSPFAIIASDPDGAFSLSRSRCHASRSRRSTGVCKPRLRSASASGPASASSSAMRWSS